MLRCESGLLSRNATRILQVTALRDDIVRVRVGRADKLPEDASWAVLATSRAARAAVQYDANGFTTAALSVVVDPDTGALTILDRPGSRLVLDDAGPEPCQITEAEGFRLTKKLAPDTHIFGLGDKAGPLDRRGRSFVLWNTDAYQFQESTDPLYKTIPFFIGFDRGAAFGLFLDNSYRSHFEFGVLHPGRLSFGADGGSIDYYVMAGPEPKAVQEAYAWLTGPPPLPPLWSLGFQQSRYSYMSRAEILSVAQRMRAERIPCDVLWFDIDVLDRNRPFTINETEFADFPGLVAELAQNGFRSVIITDLHVPALPGENYAPYDGLVAGDHGVQAADGSPYLGRVWPGACHFPDFTREATRRWWGRLFAAGPVSCADGIWNDMNEPSVFGTASRTMPLDVIHRIEEPGFAARPATHREIHNLLGMQNARATTEGLLEARPTLRPFVMSRASYAGGHRTSVTWTGDSSSSWNHLRMSTPMLLSLGLGGFAFAGCDLGGFSGSPTPDLLTQWLCLGMFNPIARNHTDKGSRRQENWQDGEPHSAIRRRAVEERYQLLPYLYSLAEEASRTGLPIMRPMFMEFPQAGDADPLDIKAGAQFMFGPSLLVAPAPNPECLDQYDVLLPPGDWFDYWTGLPLAGVRAAKAAGGSGDAIELAAAADQALHAISVKPSPDRLPVFARAGSIIPRQPLVQHTGERPEGPLELLIYPHTGACGSIYCDDGVSFGFRQGEFLRIRFACAIAVDGEVAITIGPREGAFAPWWHEIELVLHRAGTSGACIRRKIADNPDGTTIRFPSTRNDQ